ncbi:Dyla-1 [Aphelenchoides besseyi]|nr:Dyla-1 [Aphelenchoides besseyi]
MQTKKSVPNSPPKSAITNRPTAPQSVQPSAAPSIPSTSHSVARSAVPATLRSPTSSLGKIEEQLPPLALGDVENNAKSANATAVPSVIQTPTNRQMEELKFPPATPHSQSTTKPQTPVQPITPLPMPVQSPPTSPPRSQFSQRPKDSFRSLGPTQILSPKSLQEFVLQQEIEGITLPQQAQKSAAELPPAPIIPRRKSRMPHGGRVSLVQYNNPEPVPADEATDETPNPVDELKRIASCTLPPIEPEKQLRCIMDCILPPRKREIDGKSWLERASTVPSTRFDLLGLQQKFENELKISRSKSFGICPLRRRIYDEMFGEFDQNQLTNTNPDELIRQVTINCAERGLLLLRVRDEIHLTILSYQSLLESSIGYGIRKAIVVEQQQSQAIMDRDLERAKNVVEELEKQLKQERLIKEEEVKLLEEKMKDENERLAESNRTLKMHLQAILQMDQQLQVAQSTLKNVSNGNGVD